MGICLVGVVVSFCIYYVADDNSFIYDDEEQIEEEGLVEENDQ